MVSFYDPGSLEELGRIERVLAAGGVEFVVLPRRAGDALPGTVGVAEEDLALAEALLRAQRTRSRH